MSFILRPMSTGEVLDRTFFLYRSNFLFFAGIGTLPALTFFVAIFLSQLSGKFMPAWTGDVANVLTAALLGLVYATVFLSIAFLGVAMAAGATVYAVSRIHLGYTTTIWQSYKQVGRLSGRILRIVLTIAVRMFGAWLLLYLLIIGVGFGLRLLARMGIFNPSPSSLGFQILGVVLAAAFLFAGLFWSARIACRFALAVAGCVLEKLKARPALKRSKYLAKGALFRIFLVCLLVLFVGLPVFYVTQMPGMFSNYMSQGIPNLIQVLCGSLISTALAFPIGAIGTCLVYYDQRVRKEAFDLQIMMESIVQPALEQAASAPGIG